MAWRMRQAYVNRNDFRTVRSEPHAQNNDGQTEDRLLD
jgi:hypothetical protein